MPKVYEGDHDYIAVSYARADRRTALPIIEALADAGYRVWYDKGIKVGILFPNRIADRLHDCACVVTLVSRSSLASDWCMHEVNYALDLRKPILPVYLEDVELSRALQMRMGSVQALFWYKYENDAEFLSELLEAPILYPCLTPEGKERQGVKPRVVQDAQGDLSAIAIANKSDSVFKHNRKDASEDKVEDGNRDDAEQENEQVHKRTRITAWLLAIAIGLVVGIVIWNALGQVTTGALREPYDWQLDATKSDEPVPGVPVRQVLDDYKWSELKLLSQSIAHADYNYEWLEIAKRYKLVDDEGRLQGDTKVFTLDDGTRTSIRILGFRHDELVSGGRSGITFEFADIPAVHEMNNDGTNAGGWNACEMRNWLNTDFIRLLPQGLQSCIEPVRKKANNSGLVENEDDTSVVTSTPGGDKLWLLSLTEVYGKVSTQVDNGLYSSVTYDEEGRQYQLYSDKGVSLSNHIFCKKGGVDSWWWLRSPSAYASSGFLGVLEDGSKLFWCHPGSDKGVSPGFCF